MSRLHFVAGGGFLVFAMAGSQACGDSGSGTGGAGSSSLTATASSGEGGAATLGCQYYCDRITSLCTDQNQQYLDLANCLTVCSSFPLGALGDKSADTLGCRIVEEEFLKMAPDTKCAHAGPSGGDLRGTQPGICGDGCEAFCNLEAVTCTDTLAQYASKAECMTACQSFPGQASSDDFDLGDTAGDTYNCRLYHLVAAASDPDTHCKHTKPSATGDPCK